MDWAKILFCLYLAVSNGVSTNISGSKNDNIPRIEKLNSTISNSTKSAEETLEGSPSEAIQFKNPIVFRERGKDVPTNKNHGVASLKTKNNQARSSTDLKKEANEYSPVLSFRESAVPNLHRQWQIQPELTHYREQNEFQSPIPIIESQSFINKPRMTSTQINYSPQGNLEGRNFGHGSAEYPDVHPNNDGHSYPEPDQNPGRGHTVHTETTHDYGRFLPVNYKSKIEMEAEDLIKQRKAQNASSTQRPEQNDRDNNQRAPGYYSRYQQPVNTAFFHKGGFENAYKFPLDDHTDQRHIYTQEKYVPHTYEQRQPVTSTEGYSYGPRQPVTSTETYNPQYSYPTERYPSSPHQGPPNAPRDYDISTEKYAPTYSGDAFEKSVPSYPETTPHSPRQYGPQVEQPLTQYNNDENKYLTYNENPNQPPPYREPVEQPLPQYNDEKKFLTSYNENPNQPPPHREPIEQPLTQYNDDKKFLTSYENPNQPHPHTEAGPKDFRRPYSNNPTIESPISLRDPPHYTKHSVTDSPHSNEPYAKTVDDVSGEKAYYSTFKSLMDLYKSIGFHFQPFGLDDLPIIQHSQFAIRNPFDAKFAVSSPVSVSSEDFLPNSNGPKYSGNTHSHTPTEQSYDHSRRPYSDTRYKVNSPGSSYHRNPPVRSKYSNYHEQVPFDSNRSPVVSTEHYDSHENPRPEYNSQVESPKETFASDEFDTKTYSGSKTVKHAPVEDIKVKGIRIKDYDSKSYFGDPSQKEYSSAESDFSSGASPPDIPNHSHSVVREKPYDNEDHYSGEARTTYRPRVYRQKVAIEDLNPDVSAERVSNVHSSDERNKFHSSKGLDNSRDSSRDTFGSYPGSIEDQNKYRIPDSEMPMKPANKRPQVKSRSNRKSKKQNKGEKSFNEQDERSSRKRKTEQNYRTTPFQGDFSYSEPEQRSKSVHTENQESRSSKRNGKRSSQRSPKKHKSNSRSQRDHMRAEGSTYHWGMERHKGTDGFFQYANVPGAKAFEFGYRMGGPEHNRERHHKTKGTHSKIKVNWEDENGDTGDHYWEFNHDSREDDTEEKKPERKSKRKEKSDEE